MTEIALGELQALVAKAARGAGRPFGVAEDAGRAARWLAARGQDGAGAILRLLQATDGLAHGALAPRLPGLETGGAALCPLILGAYLSDAGEVPDAAMGPVLEPLLLVPFLSELAGEGAIAMVAGAVTCTIQAEAMHGAALSVGPVMVRISRDDTAPGASQPKASRAEIGDDILGLLATFAARTFAPATEASRAMGAGAGTSDND